MGGRRRSAVLRRLTAVAVAAGVLGTPAIAGPYIPTDADAALADLPAGAHHSDLAARNGARSRIDVTLPLAQFYIGQSRSTGDLRFLGYAEAVLAPWITGATPVPAALVLQATIQQSRHQFAASLATLERALALKPDDPQAWLTRATVLRVLGRYDEAAAACTEFSTRADPAVGAICAEGVHALQNDPQAAYTALARVPVQGMQAPERAWRASELGEIAGRLGNDREAEHWFREAIDLNPHDFYVRAAYADLLLRENRPDDVLGLLAGEGSIEPLLLRMAIAQKRSGDPGLGHSRALLEAAFAAETARKEAIHGREMARYFLTVCDDPGRALEAALANWQVQREPDDALVLIESARAAGSPQRAAAALAFVHDRGLRDVRLGLEPGKPS